MKLFLRLQHWQIFLISWGPVVLVITMSVSPLIVRNYFQLWLVLFMVGLMNSFVWVWSINDELQRFSQTINTKLFKVVFWIPFVYIWSFIAFMLFNLFVRKVKSINIEIEIMIFTIVGVISICCIFYGLIYIARLIRSVELGKKPSIRDHFMESVLMLFPPIGLWIIQPKLNKIIDRRV